MTRSWRGLLNGDDDRSSHSYDFIEARPVWETWQFRISVAAAGICLLWFFWQAL